MARKARRSRQTLPRNWERGKEFNRTNIADYIRKEVSQGVSPDSTHWSRKADPAKVYKAVRRNRFFGHKDWNRYLEKDPGIGRIRHRGKYAVPFPLSEESARSFVLRRLERGVSTSTWVWQQDPGLNAVYRFLRRRKFLGAGTWNEYIEKNLKKRATKDRQKIEAIRSLVQTEPLSTAHWQYTPRLKKYYSFLVSKKFFGHKTWVGFLEHELGVRRQQVVGEYVLPKDLTKPDVLFFIRTRLRDEIPMNARFWEKTPGLRSVYWFCLRNELFGFKTWNALVNSLVPKPK